MTSETLVSVVTLLPSATPRKVARLCRTGKIPGAVKVGRIWMITESAWREYTTAATAPTCDADALLRKFGYA